MKNYIQTLNTIEDTYAQYDFEYSDIYNNL